MGYIIGCCCSMLHDVWLLCHISVYGCYTSIIYLPIAYPCMLHMRTYRYYYTVAYTLYSYICSNRCILPSFGHTPETPPKPPSRPPGQAPNRHMPKYPKNAAGIHTFRPNPVQDPPRTTPARPPFWSIFGVLGAPQIPPILTTFWMYAVLCSYR